MSESPSIQRNHWTDGVLTVWYDKKYSWKIADLPRCNRISYHYMTNFDCLRKIKWLNFVCGAWYMNGFMIMQYFPVHWKRKSRIKISRSTSSLCPTWLKQQMFTWIRASIKMTKTLISISVSYIIHTTYICTAHIMWLSRFTSHQSD